MGWGIQIICRLLNFFANVLTNIHIQGVLEKMSKFLKPFQQNGDIFSGTPCSLWENNIYGHPELKNFRGINLYISNVTFLN